jgi:lysine decarboxylase
MNVFDPEIAPGVSVPVRNGMSSDEMFKSLKFAFKNYSVTSADITEFNPLNDTNGKTAELVDDIVQYMMNPDY